jgi:hypothetical protein
MLLVAVIALCVFILAGCAAEAERRCQEAQVIYDGIEAPTAVQTGLAITACVR